jgi:MYXO-CTERM domain-containing protein
MAPGSGNGTSALMLALGALGLASSRRRRSV